VLGGGQPVDLMINQDADAPKAGGESPLWKLVISIIVLVVYALAA